MSDMAKSTPKPQMSDDWDMKAHFERAASSYERQTGGLTRSISRHLIEVSEPPLSSHSIVLDVATGPGITCSEILRQLPKDRHPKEIHAVDLSPAMIRQVEQRGHPEITAAVMDAQDLKFPDNYFSHIYEAFAIFSLPDPVKGSKELYRTLQVGGTAYVTTWASLGWAAPVNRAIHKMRPDAPKYKGPLPEEWFQAEKLQGVLAAGGFDESTIAVNRLAITVGDEMWDGCKDFLRSGVMNTVVADWSATENDQFFKLIDEEIDAEKKGGVNPDMPAWVGTALKG